MLVAVLAAYAGAVVWLTWPLAARITTHLPNTHPACNFDLLQTGWVLAHQSRALFEAPSTIADAPIYHPAANTLFYADAAFGALPFFLPPFLLTGNPTLALNLVFLVAAALTAFALHVVVRHWTGSHAAGFVAGATFLLTRWTFWDFAPTAPQYLVLCWFPFVILLATRPPSRARDLGLAGLVALQSLSSPVYVSVALLAPLGALAMIRLLVPGRRGDGIRLLGAMALAIVLLAPTVAGYVQVRLADPDVGTQTYWRWWRPVTALPWGPLAAPHVPTAVMPIAFALALVGVVSRALPWRATAPPVPWFVLGHVALWALGGIVLGITPDATWNGRPARIPHTVLAEWLPLYRTIRETMRLGVAGLMGLALAAGLGFTLAAARLPWRGRGARFAVALLVALVLGEAYREYRAPGPLDRAPLRGPYPLVRVPAADDPLVRALAAGAGPVLEVPVGLTPYGCLPGLHARAMYRAIFHRRPLLNGYGGYWPDGFLERMQTASRLPHPDALAALRDETGLTTIVVHTMMFPPGERRPWEAALTSGTPHLTPVGRYGVAVVLAVRDR